MNQRLHGAVSCGYRLLSMNDEGFNMKVKLDQSLLFRLSMLRWICGQHISWQPSIMAAQSALCKPLAKQVRRHLPL